MAPVPVTPPWPPELCWCFSISTVLPPPHPRPGSATPWKCDSPKHPEADVAVASHPGLILNCAVFLSKLHGHLPPPGDR